MKSFINVDKNSVVFRDVVQIMEGKIAKIYGSQEKAIDLIGKSEDRVCEVMLDDGEPVGILVYKRIIKNKSLVLKTLTLKSPKQDSGKGYGKRLLDQTMLAAYSRGAEKISVSVSDEVPEALAFFKKQGFSEVRSIKDKYNKGSTEIYLEATVTLPYEYKKHTERLAQPVRSSNFFANVRPAHHTCTLKLQYVNEMLEGTKTIEGRPCTKMFERYREGDTVNFFAGNHGSVCVKITSVNKYATLDEMLQKNDISKLLPSEARRYSGNKLFSIAKQAYLSIPGYEEKIAANGMLAIKVKVIDKQETLQSASSSKKRGRDNQYDDSSYKRSR
ncbi:MAG: GNAT family N-acetyltransferase [Pseudomonadota bacterium]|nr:GNAT family N-acetyltransferase [Pseudomonadota bacterium]